MRYSQHSIMPQRATARLHTLSISDPLPQGQNVIFFVKQNQSQMLKMQIWLHKQSESQWFFYRQHPEQLNKAKILSISLTDKDPQRSGVTCPKAGT